MALFSNVLKIESRNTQWNEKIKAYLSGDDISDYDTQSGINITERNSLQVTTVYKCVDKIAKTIATLPFNIYRNIEGGGKEKAPDHKSQYMLHTKTNYLMTATEFWKTMMAHLLLWGNAYAKKVIEQNAYVVEMYIFSPDRMKVERSNNGRLKYTYTFGNGRQEDFTDSEILHLRDLSLDGIMGLSRIQQAKEGIGLAKQTERFGATLFSKGSRPAGALQHPGSLSEKAHENLRNSIMKQKSLGTLILEEGMTWQSIGIPPEDAQFLETRKFQAEDIAGLFDIPPHKIGLLDRATFNNIEHLGIEFVTDTILPFTIYIEQKCDCEILPSFEQGKYFTKHVVDALLRGDSQSRGVFYNTMFQCGVLSPNDIRELEDKNPIEGGDEHFVQLNMIPLSQVGQYPTFPESKPNDEEPNKEPDNENNMIKRVNEKRTLSHRQMRSIIGRNRLISSYRRLFVDAAKRTLHVEVNAIRNKLKIINNRSKVDFIGWMNEFYEGTIKELINKNMLPLLMSYAEAVQVEANQEVNREPEMTSELEEFTNKYAQNYTYNYIKSSKGQINSILTDNNGEDAENAVEERINEWQTKRPEKEAERQSIESNMAFSKFVFAAAGIETLMWVAQGSKPCPYCRELDGTVVGINKNFVDKNGDLQPEGQEPMKSYQNKSHPPLHGGCVCTIVAT